MPDGWNHTTQTKEESRQLALNFGRHSAWNCQRMLEKGEGEKKKKSKNLRGTLISITSVVELFPLWAGYFPAQ